MVRDILALVAMSVILLPVFSPLPLVLKPENAQFLRYLLILGTPPFLMEALSSPF